MNNNTGALTKEALQETFDSLLKIDGSKEYQFGKYYSTDPAQLKAKAAIQAEEDKAIFASINAVVDKENHLEKFKKLPAWKIIKH